MRIGNTFVTGPVGASELDRACRNHELGTLFLCMTRPLFGHPLQFSALACGLPLARFDWCGQYRAGRPGDLLLDPGAPRGELIAALTRWVRSS
jgi:hypothetical protein